MRINKAAGWLFLIGVFCLTGCQTTDQADSGHMASVEISGHPQAEIQKATETAFRANGYRKVGSLTFEKQGSGWETVNYGGWSGSAAWIRMRAQIVYVETGKYALGCNAYVVEGHGEIGTEVERKFLFAKRKECKKILDEAKAALEGATPPAGTSRQ